MRKGFKKALSFVLSAAMLVSLGSGLDISTAGAENTTAGTTTEGEAAQGFYKAMVGFQTSGYDCRDGYKPDQIRADAAYNTWLTENGKTVPAYNGINIYQNGNVASLKKDGTIKKPEKVELYPDAAVTDVKMTKDGEYTVSVSNLKLDETVAAGGIFNMLYVATNIPVAEGDNISVKASSIKVAGQDIATDAALPSKGDLKVGGQYIFMAADAYASETDKKGYTNLPLYYDTADKSKDLKVPEGTFDVEITFSVEGVDWSKAPTTDDVPTPAPTQVPTTAPVVTPPPVVNLKTSFDMYLSANVNDGLTPETATELISPTTGKKIQ